MTNRNLLGYYSIIKFAKLAIIEGVDSYILFN